MTAQTVFTKVVRHLLAQGRRASNGVSCMYRNSEGLKCAVGCLISDKNYNANMEGWPVEALADTNELPQFLREHVALLEKLQCVHDCYEPRQWESELKVVANTFGLKYRPLKIA